jgi:hypothetical protein
MMMCKVLVVLVCSALCDAALPPGIEDEMYCPKSFCQRSKPNPSGMLGPQSMFRECYDAADDATEPVTTWGSEVDGEAGKNKLINENYHTSSCKPQLSSTTPSSLHYVTSPPELEMSSGGVGYSVGDTLTMGEDTEGWTTAAKLGELVCVMSAGE